MNNDFQKCYYSEFVNDLSISTEERIHGIEESVWVIEHHEIFGVVIYDEMISFQLSVL